MEVAMATRNVSKQAGALAKARDRRRVLDRARDEQDQRIEEATASALVALEVRSGAERSLGSATSKVGEALKLLLAEDVSVDRAAALLELDVSEVRRLVKPAPVRGGESVARPQSGGKATVTVLPDASGGDGAPRRAG
jgi:DNA-directed RNA polymerase specialized sigma24 family protein